MEEQGIIDAILTIDSVILVGGAKTVIIDADRSVKDVTKPNCNVVRYSDVEGCVRKMFNIVDVMREDVVAAAVWLGSDYNRIWLV